MSNKSAYEGVTSDMRVTRDAKLINSVTTVIHQPMIAITKSTIFDTNIFEDPFFVRSVDLYAHFCNHIR